MPRYDEEAKETCLQLYLKYNGGNQPAIEAGMREAGYVNFSKSNISKWAKERDWPTALKMRLLLSAEGTTTSAELLFLEVEKVRRQLFKQLSTKGAKADRDLIYQYRDLAELCRKCLASLAEARDNYAGFAKFWQDLMNAPKDKVPEQAIRVLVKFTDAIIDWAKEKYANVDAGNS
jgi:hypothetical protein